MLNMAENRILCYLQSLEVDCQESICKYDYGIRLGFLRGMEEEMTFPISRSICNKKEGANRESTVWSCYLLFVSTLATLKSTRSVVYHVHGILFNVSPRRAQLIIRNVNTLAEYLLVGCRGEQLE